MVDPSQTSGEPLPLGTPLVASGDSGDVGAPGDVEASGAGDADELGMVASFPIPWRRARERVEGERWVQLVESVWYLKGARVNEGGGG